MADEKRFVQVIPTNGDVIHARAVHGDGGWMYPERRKADPSSVAGRLLVGTSLCGVRGKDAMGWGGMAAVLDDNGEPVLFDHENVPPPKVGWNDNTINVVCPKCVSRMRRYLAETGRA